MPTYLDAQHGVSLSEAYAEAAASAPAERLMHYTYELSHPLFDERICIVNDFENLTATLEGGDTVDFIACPVDVVGPDESDARKSPTISVKIDGVSSIVVGQLDKALGSLDKITITERVYASDDLSAPAVMPPLTLTLISVDVGETSVTAEAGFSDPVNLGFPAKEYTMREYPGMAAR